MFRHVLGFEREEVFIADVVNRVPSNGGRPSLDEIERSLPFLKEQILKCQPELVLVMGNVACQALFGPQANVSRIRGKWQEIDMAEGSIRVLPTFHPKYLLQNPDDKRLCFADLKEMRMALDQADG